MKTSAEFEIKVSGGRITKAQVMPDGSCKVMVELVTTTTEDTTCHQLESIFKRVPASELRLDDAFMKHQPKTNAERNFKELVETAIKNGLKDFWRPVYDPSFDDNGRIYYEPGKMPAVGKSYNWWEKNAKVFCPERGSRIGTKSEYIAFLAVLIKDLVTAGKSVEWAWNAVCNDSKELGHYWNSKDAKHAKHAFETTGSRDICGWYDLANSFKILEEDEEAVGFWLAGGNYNDVGCNCPLADLFLYDFRDSGNCDCCGWLVLTEGSTDH